MITMVSKMVNRIEHGDEQDMFKTDIPHFEQSLTLSEVPETFEATTQRATFVPL